MKHSTLNRQYSRELDRRAIEQYGMSGMVLMENAGRGVADRIIAWGVEGPVCILCGKGNNAGDGFVIARHLANHGFEVQVVLLADPSSLTADAEKNFAILHRMDVSMSAGTEKLEALSNERKSSQPDWIVDALLGTGAQGKPRSPLDGAIAWMNQMDSRKLAVDLPSGLDCDTGAAASSIFVADYTCTLATAKPGFFQNDGPRVTGQLAVIDIGVPKKLVTDLLREFQESLG